MISVLARAAGRTVGTTKDLAQRVGADQAWLTTEELLVAVEASLAQAPAAR